MKNKVIHAVIFAIFSYGCLGAWQLLMPIEHYKLGKEGLPRFTTFCMNLRPTVFVFIAAAFCYCVWVWCRPKERVPLWIGFFAVATGVLVLVDSAAIVAVFLPTIQLLEMAGK